MIALIASLLALAIGPLIYSRAARESRLARGLDGFVFVAITGLVLLEVLPDVVAHAGWWVLGLVALGLWGPSWLERFFHRTAHRTHMATVLLSATGLVVHTIFDGAAIGEGGSAALGLAIVIHRVPVSLAVWWLLRPVWGSLMPSLMLLAMALGTLLGYLLGTELQAPATEAGFAALQAFVAGSILHVVFNRPHLDPALATRPGPDRAEGVGSLIGLLVFLTMLGSELRLGHAPTDGLERFLELSLAAAPALILAYAAGGLIAAFMPASSMQWLGRGGHFSQAARGVVVGLPLPVCSCGVVPLYHSFIRKGAPPSAALAFLIATPELGLDAILVSIPLLGADMTIARVLAAAVVALGVGWGLGRFARLLSGDHSGCGHEHLPTMHGSVLDRTVAGLRYGFGDLVDATVPWVLLGLIIAAGAQPLLEQAWLQQVPPSLQVIVFALLGLPLYVCATGSTPIVAVMLLAGVAPGAALAFLLTGPATNPATFGVLSRLHGPGLATAFGVATGGLAIASGLLVNHLSLDLNLSGAQLHAFPGWITWPSLLVFAGLILASVARRGARRFVSELQFGRAEVH